MSGYERNKIELELRISITKNLKKPSECNNLDQIRFYVAELCSKIQELKDKCNYVPDWAYTLLAQYNDKQNLMLYAEFKNAYV